MGGCCYTKKFSNNQQWRYGRFSTNFRPFVRLFESGPGSRYFSWMRIKILYITCAILAALRAAEIPELVFEMSSYYNSIYIWNQLSIWSCYFWVFRGFLFGKNMFIGVFEGVECDFDNNFSDWIGFKNFNFWTVFDPEKICQKLKKFVKKFRIFQFEWNKA